LSPIRNGYRVSRRIPATEAIRVRLDQPEARSRSWEFLA